MYEKKKSKYKVKATLQFWSYSFPPPPNAYYSRKNCKITKKFISRSKNSARNYCGKSLLRRFIIFSPGLIRVLGEKKKKTKIVRVDFALHSFLFESIYKSEIRNKIYEKMRIFQNFRAFVSQVNGIEEG